MTPYLLAALAGAVLSWVILQRFGQRGESAALSAQRDESRRALEQAAQENQRRLEETNRALRAELEEQEKAQRAQLKKQEKEFQQRETALAQLDEGLAQQEARLSKREKDLVRKERRLERQAEEVDERLKEAHTRLEQAAGLSPERAKQMLIEEVRDEARRKSLDDIRAIEHETRAIADERARLIIASAIQRYASAQVSDHTITNVSLSSDDLKGRIIGRDGRNIRAFEAATGCDIVVDDTPETVLISSFDPVRREIARRALEKLLSDGRIHPASIEDVVTRTRDEFELSLRKTGEEAAQQLELTGLHPKLLETLGRLNYMTSFGKNMLQHSIEVGWLSGLIAGELEQNIKAARRAGLLHDIGKATDHELEGDHTTAGAELLRKCGEKKEIIQVVSGHHRPEKQTTVLAHIVAAANQLSTSRPGARREALESYIKRLKDLEKLALGFEGVERVYALRAGSTLQVIVDNARLNDRDAEMLARDIAQRIEQEQQHPGEITVTVLRQTRAIHYAR